jgi:hypothetical protein
MSIIWNLIKAKWHDIKGNAKPFDKAVLMLGLTEIGIMIIFVAMLLHNPPAIPLAHIYNKISHQRVVTYLIFANVPHWQPTYKLGTDELAIVTVPMQSASANGAWGTSPSLGDSDAGGYSKTVAGNKFPYPGAPEGCLIIKYGETHFDYWTNSNESKSFTNAGTIYFMANDEMNGAGLYFGDNRGKIEITITITKIRQTNDGAEFQIKSKEILRDKS